VSRERASAIGILVLDARPVIRSALASLLETQPELHVLGDAAIGTECVEKVTTMRPDVILIGLDTGDVDAYEVLRALQNAHPNIPVIAFGGDNDEWQLLEAIRAGVHGYLLRDTSTENLVKAIRVVSQRRSFLDPALHAAVIEAVTQTKKQRRSSKSHFSDCERAILRLLAQGKSNKAIAEARLVSTSTVKSHVSNILSKLDASNRTEAVSIAVERGIITPHTRS